MTEAGEDPVGADASYKARAHELMEEALALLDQIGEHHAGALLDHAIHVLDLRAAYAAQAPSWTTLSPDP